MVYVHSIKNCRYVALDSGAQQCGRQTCIKDRMVYLGCTISWVIKKHMINGVWGRARNGMGTSPLKSLQTTPLLGIDPHAHPYHSSVLLCPLNAITHTALVGLSNQSEQMLQ